MTEPKSLFETPVRLSASSMSTLGDCPRRWKFKYIDKKSEPPGEAAMVGSFVHEVLENFYLYTPSFRTEDAIKGLARSMWADFIEGFTKEFPHSDLDEPELKRQVWHSLMGIWAFEDPQRVETHSVEMQVDAKYQGLPFIGFVDRIDVAGDSLIVVDYKSGKAGRPDYMPPKLMQLMLYVWALDQMDIHADQAKLYFVKERKIIFTDIDAATRKKVADYLAKAVDKLAKYFDEGFPAKPGPLCGWCSHITYCPEGEAGFWAMANKGRMRKDAPAFAFLLEAAGALDTNVYTNEDDLRASFGR